MRDYRWSGSALLHCPNIFVRFRTPPTSLLKMLDRGCRQPESQRRVRFDSFTACRHMPSPSRQRRLSDSVIEAPAQVVELQFVQDLRQPLAGVAARRIAATGDDQFVFH